MQSYTFGLLYNNAFRALKIHTNTLLKKYELTSYEWALLGILYNKPNGCRGTELARRLQVSKPFISKTTRALQAKGWIAYMPHDTDTRSVRITLTPTAQATIPEIEAYLKTEMRPVFDGVNKIQLYVFTTVLQHIVKKLDKKTAGTAVTLEN